MWQANVAFDNLKIKEKFKIDELLIEDFFQKIVEKSQDIDGFLKVKKLINEDVKYVEILFCEDSAMVNYQSKYRDKNITTDVLSFCNIEGLDGKQIQELKINTLGQIIISPYVVQKNSQENNRVFLQELADVIVHGWLHLLGYDHVDCEEQAKEMFNIQESLIAECKLIN